jgi:hypothetical protein
MFTENQVSQALDELKTPDVSNWEVFAEVANFRVFRRSVTGSALKEYKVLGSYPDLPVRYLLRAYTDLDLRKTWDKNMSSWQPLDNDRLHFVAKFPWPLSPRDYVYELRVQKFDNGVVCINGKSVVDDKMPEKSGVVRVDEFRQDVIIQPTEDGKGCNIWFGYFDNPKVGVSVWLSPNCSCAGCVHFCLLFSCIVEFFVHPTELRRMHKKCQANQCRFCCCRYCCRCISSCAYVFL